MKKNVPFSYAFFNHSVVKTENAKVSIMTNALQYGTGVFGGVRGYYNKNEGYLSIFRLEDHMKRFLSSLNIVGVGFDYSQRELVEIVKKLVEKNKPQTDTYFRPFAYAGSTNLSPNLSGDPVFQFALYMMPLGEYLPVDKGLCVGVSSWRRIPDNAIPSRAKISGGYINSALARAEAEKHGYDEAIFLTQEGTVAEGSAENLFIVRDGVLVTSAKTDDVLEGITRRTILQIASDLGIPTEERTVDRSELYICDEAFFSGTGVQVSWIAKIDNRKVGEGKRGSITAKVQDLFFRIVHGEEQKYSAWCTKLKTTQL
ncbi:MAG: branched-chain amino acid transaminase [bacterium]